MRRVVITGMGGVTALGNNWEQIEARLRAGKNAVQRIPEWDHYEMLNTRLAAPITDFRAPAHYPRKRIRSMGRVSLLSVRATEYALAEAGLSDNTMICDGRMGIAYGSSSGSIEPVRVASNMLATRSLRGLTSTSYIQMMPHTTAVNTCLYFGLKGRIIPTSSACTSGSQAIGYAFESIRTGRQELMVAGGADELSVLSAAVFDTLFATSTRNNIPETTPRPFDSGRDGLVIGEGAAALILEEYEAAQARGARILAEVVGFGTNSSGAHITQPDAESQAMAMQLALADADISPSAIGYVSAHGTATDLGDIAEVQATRDILGRVPTSAMKSYIGHTLGACGAIEAWWGIEMMRRGWFAPTINLEDIDPACEGLDHITGSGRDMTPEYFMSNNFAFGGINTSLIFRRV